MNIYIHTYVEDERDKERARALFCLLTDSSIDR